LAAELSDATFDRLAAILASHAPQLLFTALPGRAPKAWQAMFHVEHGRIEPAHQPLRAVAV